MQYKKRHINIITNFNHKIFFSLQCQVKKFAFILLLSVLSISVQSSDTKFYNINSLYGISIREAASVCMDDNGFIWASSKTGILRLTEDDYHLYQLPYETANIINVKLVYHSPDLLAYTNNGQIFLYDAISDRFKLAINLSKELKNNYLGISSVLIEDNNRWWFSTSWGLFKYEKGQLTIVNNLNMYISKIEWYNNHQFFVAAGSNISIFDTQTQQLTPLYTTDIQGFEVNEFYFDQTKEQLWMGTRSNGLFHYDFKTKTFKGLTISAFPKQPILSIEANSDHSLLIGIDGQGIWEIDKRGERVLNIFKENSDNPSSLRGNGVYDIFCDHKNRVWICTYSGGVSYYEQASPLVTQLTHSINGTNSLIDNDVNCIIEDHKGNIWFATNNGISCWNVSANHWQSFYNNKQEQAQVFLTLCEDDQGRIWAGSYSSGVYILDENSGRKLAHYSSQEKNSPFVNDFVFDIYKDRHGNIWIGGVNAEIICYQPLENKFEKFSYQPLNAFGELNSREMLLGCTYGLCLLDNQTKQTKVLIESLVHDILVLDGIIWVGTSGDGLIRYDTKSGKTEKYTTESGLPSNFVNSITYADGYLWAGTENGLCRFDPKDKSVLIFSSILSLSRSSFNRNSHFKLRNGQLAWGTNNGAMLFNPKTIQQIQSKGKIFFQDLTISGRSIRDYTTFKLNNPLDSLKKITLKHDQNTILLELLPIGTAAGAKFSWKMEGVDEEWSQPSNLRTISYTNIPSKDLSLKIRMYDSSMSQIISERTLQLRMIPPFWKTWWFMTLSFLIISCIIYLYLWYYINRLKQLHSEEKIRFFAKTAHDIRTSLTLINAPIEELNKEQKLTEQGQYYLHIAGEQTKRLASISSQILDFQKLDSGKGQLSLQMVDIVKLISHRILMFESFAKSKDIELSFTSNLPFYRSAIDELMMEKVVDNLISNAVKYSHPKHQVQITLKCNKNEWVLEVTDQGIGISKKAQQQLFREFYRGENAVNSKIVGSGIGLMLVKNYVKIHGGEISCSSQENAGSTFQIVIPYKEIADVPTSEKTARTVSQNADRREMEIPQREYQQGEMSILIVEDNDDLRNFMFCSLSNDFHVFTAPDGITAWETIQNQIPDLVVSDVMMPNMDGFELCQRIKSTFNTSHIPVILLTALSEKAEQLHGLGLGADDYLTKPFDMSLLSVRIKSIIKNREAVRKKMQKLPSENNNEPILANKLNDKFIKKAMEVVQSNISNSEFDKDEFASAMNVSTSLLYKKIKALTDQSPTDYIKTIRLNHALELLQTRRYTVTEVSELCGFTSVGYFSTVFKKHFGQSPTEIND